MRKANGQLPFPFLAKMDGDTQERGRLEAKRMRYRNYVCYIKSNLASYPPTAEEWDIMLGGIRLCRLVGDWECQKCPYAVKDHTIGWVFKAKVCLKDAYRRGAKEEWNNY